MALSDDIVQFLSDICPYKDALSLHEIKSNGTSVFLYGMKAMQIQTMSKNQTVSIRADYVETPEVYGVSFKRMKAGDGTIRFDILSRTDFLRLHDLFLTVFEHCREDASFESFGCCSSFIACSDARECLHFHDPEYWGCQYRRNLEHNRIFYGKNANQPKREEQTASLL